MSSQNDSFPIQTMESQSKRPRSPPSQQSSHRSKRSRENGSLSNSDSIGFSETNRPLPDTMAHFHSLASSPMPYDLSSDLAQWPNNYRRIDIGSDSRNLRQINLNLSEETGPVSESSAIASGPQLVIWGTDVSINECRKKFKDFFRTFTIDQTESELESQSSQDYFDSEIDSYVDRHGTYYMRKIRECLIIGENFLNVNCQHVLKFDENLYRQLVSYPQEVIPTFDMALNEIVENICQENGDSSRRIFVRPYNVKKTSNIRNLNPEDINQLVTISGMIIRCSNIIVEMSVGFFECSVCKWTTNVPVDRGLIAEPQVCRNCDTRYSFKLIHNRCKYTDKQQVKLQESPDDMPAGQTPYTVLLYACADLVDKVKPGERVTVTGIYRATPIRVHPKIRNVKSVFRTHIDVVHYHNVENKRLHDANIELKLSKKRIDQLIALSNLSDIYERLANSLAPSIYGHMNIKKGILLQLLGGTFKQKTQFDSFRSEINILLCGDPGTSKSQFLQYVHNLAPRSQYTSGKGSSAVGLTAYVTKDPDSNQMVLQTGALVLSDGGICCIDEFDKMNESTRSALHEVMEQQTLSIAKAGIVCQLRARSSILAAANPIESSWNKNKTIIENIQLPPTLMSRFDLIFLLLDPQDVAHDRLLAKHLISLYYKENEEAENIFLDTALLKDYIGYARANFNPVITREAEECLKNTYVEMRKVGAVKGNVGAYPRQLESLIRLSEAHAKMLFKNTVDIEDVLEARRLQCEAIRNAALDPGSGAVDISILTTGVSKRDRDMVNDIVSGLKKLLQVLKMEKVSKGEAEDDYVYLECSVIFNEICSTSTSPVGKDMFNAAMQKLNEEGFFEFASNNKTTIRIRV